MEQLRYSLFSKKKLGRIWGLIIALFCLFLNSCQTTAPLVVQQPAPDWYLSPPKDTPTFLYGAGIGYPRERAVQSALSNIAAKISVNVSSEVSLIDQSSNRDGHETFSQETRQHIRNTVDEISINNYEVKKAVELNNQFYVLVSVNRQVLAEEKILKLKDLSTRMKEAVENLNQSEIIARIRSLREIMAWVKEARPMAFIAKSLRPGLDIEPYLKSYAEYESLYQESIATLEWVIQMDKDSEALGKVIREKLSNEGYRIIDSKDPKNPNQVVIKIESTQDCYEQASRYFVKLITHIRVEDQGRSLANIHKESSGSSSLDAEKAALNAAFQMTKDVEKTDMLSFLGVD